MNASMLDPRGLVQEIDPKLYKVKSNMFPTLEVLDKISNGGKPKQPKLDYMVMFEDMPVDSLISPYYGGTVAGDTGFERYALVTPTNAWNPNSDQIRYHPQDHIYNPETMQEYEVVMTPTESILIYDGPKNDSGNYLTGMPTTLTGSAANRTAVGTILIKNVQPEPIKHFTEATVFPGSRVYFDAQDRDGHSTYQEPVYDCNFVESFEFMQEWDLESKEEWEVKYEFMKFDPVWVNNLQKQMQKEEFAALFGKKSYDVVGIENKAGDGREKRTMEGILSGTNTFVTYFQPQGMNERAYEKFYQGAIWEMFNAYGNIEDKIVYAGDNHMMAMANMLSNRRVVDMNLSKDKPIVMSTDTYEFMGKRIHFMQSNLFHLQKYRDWLFVWDPTEISYMEMRPKQERWLQLEEQRKVKRHYEHKWGLKMPKEMHNVLIRPY
jgi:hypothetical protein